VNVRLSDLPPGTFVFQDQFFTAKQLAAHHDLPADFYSKVGLLPRCDRVFGLDVGADHHAQLHPVVTLYVTVGKAHAYYVSLVQLDKAGLAHPTVPANMKNPRLGDEQASISNVDTTNRVNPSQTTITFRRGSCVVSISALGITTRFTSSEVLHFARIVDARSQTR
jgi:hypothetical protein